MEFVITHLTRMEFPHICVAGIDLGTLENVRLVLPYPHAFTHYLHTSCGGPLDLYARLGISATIPKGRPPETEDHEITLHHIRPLGKMDHRALWSLLSSRAKRDVNSIFGPALEITRNTYSSAPGQGTVSLGFLRPRYLVKLFVRQIEDRTKLALSYQESGNRFALPVSDLRLHELKDGFPVNKAAVYAMNRQIEMASSVILSVGLTRPWAGRHWLQVNGIHIAPGDNA